MSVDQETTKSGNSVSAWIRDARVALCFLTRLPVGWPAGGDAVTLAAASRTFPVVGLVTGGLSAIFWLVLRDTGLPVLPAAVLTIGLGVLMTGALHEDGLADMADGAGAGADRERRLEIMRDSWVGAYGVLAIVFSAGLRVACLAAFPDPRFGAAALVAAHVGGRAGLPAVMRLLPRARTDGLSVTAGSPDDRSALLSAGIGIFLMLLFAGFEAGLTATALTALALWLTSIWAKRRLGGQTGDVLGGMEQIGEMVILLTLVVAIT